MSRLRVVLVCSVLLLSGRSVLHGQRVGAPGFEIPIQQSGGGLTLQYGRGQVLPAVGRVTSWGGALMVRRGRLGLMAGGAWLDPDSGSSGWNLDGAVALELCAALRPEPIEDTSGLCSLLPNQIGVLLDARAGRASVDLPGPNASIFDAALGPSVLLRGPIPVLSAEIWTSPQFRYRSANAEASGGPDETGQMGFSWSLGIGVTLVSSLGAQAMIERLWLERPPRQGMNGSYALGLSVYYLF